MPTVANVGPYKFMINTLENSYEPCTSTCGSGTKICAGLNSSVDRSWNRRHEANGARL